MYRLHIQDRHHLRALVKDCNTLKHLEDTPYRQTLRKFDQNASLFLCRLAPLIRYCLTCLLQCLTQLALRNTVNHESHYHHHRNYSAFVLQPIVGAKGSFRKRISACCCLSPYSKPFQGFRGRGRSPRCGVVGQSPTLISPKRFFIAEFIAIQLVFVATMNLPFLTSRPLSIAVLRHPLPCQRRYLSGRFGMI